MVFIKSHHSCGGDEGKCVSYFLKKIIMKLFKTLKDSDGSVNFIFDNGMEARFVQRVPEYFIVYLSSQTGCNKACRMCHLTQTGQTNMIDATIEDFAEQTSKVLGWAWQNMRDGDSVAVKKIHFNFMARGELFSNKTVNYKELFEILYGMAITHGVEIKFNISTILPEELINKEFSDIFHYNDSNIRIYYSLYSMNETFRKRWLPKAMNPKLALNKLSRFPGLFPGSEVKLHWAFIENENDSIEDLKEIFDYCDEINFHPRMNIVRYNPYSEFQGKEPSEEKIIILKEYCETRIGSNNVKIIPRVGEQVFASCGAFHN